MPNNIRILKLQLNCWKTNTVWAEENEKFLSYIRNIEMIITVIAKIWCPKLLEY